MNLQRKFARLLLTSLAQTHATDPLDAATQFWQIRALRRLATDRSNRAAIIAEGGLELMLEMLSINPIYDNQSLPFQVLDLLVDNAANWVCIP